MKKLLMFLSLCGLVLCVSCDPPMGAKRAHWYVKNSTGQVIKLNNPFRSTERSIPKGDSIEIYGTIFSPSERVFFDYFGQRMVEVCGEDVVFSVLSENDILLEEYKYADRDLPGKQLFKEFSWQHYEIPLGDLEFSRKYIWVFEIFQEDIQ